MADQSQDFQKSYQGIYEPASTPSDNDDKDTYESDSEDE